MCPPPSNPFHSPRSSFCTPLARFSSAFTFMAVRGQAASTSGLVAFATVGTTRFDLFTQSLDDPAVQIALVQLGIQKLVVQKGNSSVTPRSRVAGLKVEAFEFAQGLQAVRCAALVLRHLIRPLFAAHLQHFESASLVLSHAGERALTPPPCSRCASCLNCASRLGLNFGSFARQGAAAAVDAMHRSYLNPESNCRCRA